VIAGQHDLRPVGNDHLLPAEDQGYQRVCRRTRRIQFFQRLAREPTVMLHVHAKELHFAVGEIDNVRNARDINNAQDALHHVRFGMNDEIDAQLVFVGNPPPIGELVTADASDLHPDVRVSLSDDARQHVDLVRVGDGDQHLDRIEPRFQQRPNTRRAASNDFRVERFVQMSAASHVLFNDGDFVAFSNESAGDQRSALTAPCNEDAHRKCG
jgi:hypothetical protein